VEPEFDAMSWATWARHGAHANTETMDHRGSMLKTPSLKSSSNGTHWVKDRYHSYYNGKIRHNNTAHGVPSRNSSWVRKLRAWIKKEPSATKWAQLLKHFLSSAPQPSASKDEGCQACVKHHKEAHTWCPSRGICLSLDELAHSTPQACAAGWVTHIAHCPAKGHGSKYLRDQLHQELKEFHQGRLQQIKTQTQITKQHKASVSVRWYEVDWFFIMLMLGMLIVLIIALRGARRAKEATQEATVMDNAVVLLSDCDKTHV